jgi:L,D-peptidoglycan transpeptidase YkuD (ErfK/YbiS/YcfS/YnhG family)
LSVVTRALLLLAILVACDRKSSAPPPASTSTALPSRGYSIPRQTKQLVTAVVDDWTTTHAQLRLWQRTAVPSGQEAGALGSMTRGGWEPVGEAWPAVLGKAGTAWGIGLSPAGREGPVKKEGDMKSPAGVFAFRSVYGYADDVPKTWHMLYEQSTDLECVDDPASDYYTKIVDRKQVASDWQSSEQMRREDALYEWVLDVAHNADAKPGAGSCIFLHVWSGPEATTAGCTAMDKAKLEALLAKLDPANQPLYVLLPKPEYRAVASTWGLPAL